MAETENVRLARNILRGQAAGPDEIFRLVGLLKAEKHFGDARRLLSLARGLSAVTTRPELRRRVAQQLALCTYKDPDLPAEERFDTALAILAETDDLKKTTDQETLGLAGAAFKYRWEAFAQKQDLERSAVYYLRGYEQGIEIDEGYTGINAAYVLDILGEQERTEAERLGLPSDTAPARIEQARRIREHLVTRLGVLAEEKPGAKDRWWFMVTLAEAYFGLARFEQARESLALAVRAAPPEWELETTARQLTSIALMLLARMPAAERPVLERTPAWLVLEEFLGPRAAALRGLFIGRVGLALSGGGFRASLFHIGVLARLAEQDVLRHVEHLSCVSGGSIVGAHYYLEVKRLLETKSDAEITRDDYVALVRRIERDFLAGVQSNIRMRVVASPVANLRMAFKPGYSTTVRAGELFEALLYDRIVDGQRSPRWLNELFVQPRGEAPNFRPQDHNWRRRAKVPVLVLNATTLNTGHNWQFTASWMGEPPAGIDAEIDGNDRLRRMYYEEAPEGHRRVRLGTAVAASACVPGLFEPVVLRDLFPGFTVRLVDGGVYDNQGVASLLEQGCNVLLVSDGSGQTASVPAPPAGALGVLKRSDSVLQQRVRQSQFHDLDARRRSSLLRGLMFLHLKKDLDVEPRDWVDCKDPWAASAEARPASRRGVLTSYGIERDLQARLAAIRTDLDTFHDVEACALMTSGYRMAESELPRAMPALATSAAPREPWPFLDFEAEAAQRPAEVRALLDASSSLGFKVFQLSPALRRLAAIAVGAVAAVLLGGLVGILGAKLGAELWLLGSLGSCVASLWSRGCSAMGRLLFRLAEAPIAGWSVALLILALAALVVLVRFADAWPGRLARRVLRVLLGGVLGLVAWIFAWAYIAVIDPMYRRLGRIHASGSGEPGRRPRATAP